MDTVGFDIETAAIIPRGANWNDYRPFGITAVAFHGKVNGRLYSETLWAGKASGTPRGRMTHVEVQEVLDALSHLINTGVRVVTWNGLKFDFDVLDEESGASTSVVDLSAMHYDLMFQFFMVTGFPVSLNSVASGMGFPGKPEGINGATAPELWKTNPDLVISYVGSDARAAYDAAMAIENSGGYVKWAKKSGGVGIRKIGELMPVFRVIELPDPDQSWVQNPIKPVSFYSWWNGREAKVP